ncbi:MAG: hypothetical protein ACO3WN_10390, partial [Burkholderiaceae bacterium]
MEYLTRIDLPADRAAYRAVLDHSAYARRSLPLVLDRGQLLSCHAAVDRAAMTAHLAHHWPALVPWLSGTIAADADPEVSTALRQFRNSVLLAIMARDLAGLSDLDENLLSITSLAEMSLGIGYRAVAYQMQQRHGVPCRPDGRPVDLLVVGMGKLGGQELNASSDIDLIYVIAEEGETTG